MNRCFLLVLLSVLVAACAPAPVRHASDATLLAAQAAREAAFAGQANWSFSGRLAVSAGGEGGSGRIEWRQLGEDFEIRLSAPVTRKHWTLGRRDGEVRLDGLEGGPRFGPDAEQLLEQATGWRIPVAALADWARGLRAAGPAQIEFSAEGLPALIAQHGWIVEYRDWDGVDPARPLKVFARQGDQATVRLVVESWGTP